MIATEPRHRLMTRPTGLSAALIPAEQRVDRRQISAYAAAVHTAPDVDGPLDVRQVGLDFSGGEPRLTWNTSQAEGPFPDEDSDERCSLWIGHLDGTEREEGLRISMKMNLT